MYPCLLLHHMRLHSSPKTNVELDSKTLITNLALRHAIENWKKDRDELRLLSPPIYGMQPSHQAVTHLPATETHPP